MDKLMRAVTALGQLAILWALCLLGEQLAGFFALPGAILAMVVLLILLCTRVLPRQAVGRVGDFFQRNMAFSSSPRAWPLSSGTAWSGASWARFSSSWWSPSS